MVESLCCLNVFLPMTKDAQPRSAHVCYAGCMRALSNRLWQSLSRICSLTSSLPRRVANEEVQRAAQQAAQAARASATERDPERAHEQASEAAQKLREAGLAAAKQARSAAAAASDQVWMVCPINSLMLAEHAFDVN